MMHLAELISSGDLSQALPQGKTDARTAGEGTGTRFEEVVQLLIAAAEGEGDADMSSAEQTQSGPSIIAIGIPSNEATDAFGDDDNIPSISEKASAEVGQSQAADVLDPSVRQVEPQDLVPAEAPIDDKETSSTAAGEPPFDIKEASVAADALAEEIFAIQREDAEPHRTMTGAGISDEAAQEETSNAKAGIQPDRSPDTEKRVQDGISRVPEPVDAEEIEKELDAQNPAQLRVRGESGSRPSHLGEPKDLPARSSSQGSGLKNSPHPAAPLATGELTVLEETADVVTGDLLGQLDPAEDAGQADAESVEDPPVIRSTGRRVNDGAKTKRPGEPPSLPASNADRDARVVAGAEVIDSARTPIANENATSAEAEIAPSESDTIDAAEQIVLPLDPEVETAIDEHGKPVSSTSLTAETSSDRGTTSARPVLAPRSVVSAAWLRAMMEQGLHVHSEPEGWNSVTMRLGEEDGTMTVRTRREDGAVAVHVVFSDPNLRAMAAQQIDRLEAVLQKQYDASIDLSLSDAGADANGHRDDEPTSADSGRATLSPTHESNTSPRRSLWARNEWVV